MAIYLSIPGMRAHSRSTVGSRTLKDKLLARLYQLVFRYAPALLRLGVMVRDCSWYHRTPGTGNLAWRCLQVSLYLIQKLNPRHKDGGYKQALHLELRMWSPYHSSLHACAFVEEKGEGLLSRLAVAMGADMSITSVDDYHNVLVTLRHQQPGTLKPLTSPHISRDSVPAVSMHLTRLLAYIHAGTVPVVKKMATRPRLGARAANTLQATMQWPEDPAFPPCFNTRVADATLLYGAYRSLDVFFLLRQR